MPVRKIKPGRRSIRGYLTSPKNNGRRIEYESTLERDFYYFLEMSPKVKTYEEQPVRVTLELEESTATYVPDVFVVWHDDSLPTIYEIKPKISDFPDDKKRAMEKWCQHNGAEFKVIDAIQIKTPEVAIFKFLYQYLMVKPTQSVMNEIQKKISLSKQLSVRDISNATECKLGHIYHMIATGQLRCEGNISADTLVSLGDGQI